MMTKLVACLVICLCASALAVSCADRTVINPAAPGIPHGVPSPREFIEPFTTIEIGDVLTVTEAEADPPCEDLPGWHCLFFRTTPPADGQLDVTVTFSPRSQTLDVSFAGHLGSTTWADYGASAYELRVRASVKRDETYQITIWYTTAGGQFELRSALK